MRTSVKSALALALAVPLIAPALPAMASSSNISREKGSFADVYFDGAGSLGALPGNYASGSLTFHGSDFAEGYVLTYVCEGTQTPWGDPESGDACADAGSYSIFGSGFSVTSSKGKGKNKAVSTTYSGSVDVYNDEQGEIVAESVPFDVALTPTGATSRSTITDSFRDPASGFTYKSREKRVVKLATVQGSLGTIPAVDGSLGTFSSRSVQRSR